MSAGHYQSAKHKFARLARKRRTVQHDELTGHPLRILVVEDHPDTAGIMAKLLCHHGHEVRVASSLESTRSVLREQPQAFDVVISDIGLPDGSGLEVMRLLSGAVSTRGIALSGYDSDEDVQRSRQAGFDEHLVKPVDFQRLLELVTRLAGEEKTALISGSAPLPAD